MNERYRFANTLQINLAVANEPPEMTILSPIPIQASTYPSSKLNPENSYPSRLREEVRLSPLPQFQSPILNKRKCNYDY
jgi:hypothetical protein